MQTLFTVHRVSLGRVAQIHVFMDVRKTVLAPPIHTDLAAWSKHLPLPGFSGLLHRYR